MSDDDDLRSEQSDDDAPLPSERPTVDAANRRSVRKRERKALTDRKNVDGFWRDTIASPLGRRVVWGLLQDAHAFETRFACGPSGFPQPEATWFHAGEQAFGQRFYQNLLRIDRAGVAQMHDDHDPNFATPNSAKRET